MTPSVNFELRAPQGFANWLIFLTTLCILSVGGCQSWDGDKNTATHYCTHGDRFESELAGFSEDALEGCIVGYLEVGPQFTREADSEDLSPQPLHEACKTKFAVPAWPKDDANDVDRADALWAEQTQRAIDRMTGCYYGARGAPKNPAPSDAGVLAGTPSESAR